MPYPLSDDFDDSCSRPPSLVSTTSSTGSDGMSSHLPAPSHITSPTAYPFPSAPWPTSQKKVAFPSLAHPTEWRPPPGPINPRHQLMRERRASSPVVAQSHIHSFVSVSPTSHNLSNAASLASDRKRLSVASLASVHSFESLPEEEEAPHEPKGEEQSRLRRCSRPISSRNNSNGAAPLKKRPSAPQRRSFPTAEFQTSVLGSSPLGRGPGSRTNSASKEDELLSRAERRWRLAVELRDTERSYMAVLKFIDENYYQPLVSAIPVSDLNLRRSSKSSSLAASVPGAMPLPSPMALASRYYPFGTAPASDPNSTPPSEASAPLLPVLSRQVLSEVFSNFNDVLSLSHVMLAALEEAVSDFQPTAKPLSVFRPQTQPLQSIIRSTSSSLEPELSYSASTSSSSSSINDYPSFSSPSSDRWTSSPLDAPTQKPFRGTAHPPALGKSLLPILPFLKAYSFFISNFSFALARLSILENAEDVGWKKFCDERKDKQGLGLVSMLLSIVQRIPRYRLMLADMVRFTEKDHPDKQDLIKAFEVVDGVATHLNAQIAVHHNAHQILDLQRRFSNLDAPLVAPGRRLIKVGQVRKLDRRGNEQIRTLLLFNDLLIHASGGNFLGEGSRPTSITSSNGLSDQCADGQYRFHHRFPLEDITILSAKDEPGRFGFQIISPEKSFAVQTETPQAKQEWIDDIRTTRSQLVNDRRTLHRDDEIEEQAKARRDRRVSMPASSFQNRTTSMAPGRPRDRLGVDAPKLAFIPPSPASEIKEPDLPVLTESPQSMNSPLPLEVPPKDDDTLRRRAASEPADAQGISSFAAASNQVFDFLPVMESYLAPVWVPDSKAERCMKCTEPFSVWKRRHHCRLCGAVVCWSCSTKQFLIPSQYDDKLDRIARACDDCFSAAFPSYAESDASTTSDLTRGPHVPPYFAHPGSGTPRDVSTPPLSTPGIVSFADGNARAVRSLTTLLDRR